MLMPCAGRDRRERHRAARVRDPMLLQERLDARNVGTDERAVGDHQRLMPIADVIRERAPLAGGLRLDDKDRLGPLDDRDDKALDVEDQEVAGTQHRSARQRRAELDAAVAAPPTVNVRAILPAERHRIARIAARRVGKLIAIDPFNNSLADS